MALNRHGEFGTGRWPTLVNETPRALPPPLWGRAGVGGRAERKSNKDRRGR